MTLLNAADAIYLGDQAVDRVYLGTEQAWPANAFNPADYGDLGLWVEADQLALADGDPVTVWPDMSGHGRDFVVQNQPPTLRINALNGLPVVNFAHGQEGGYQALRAVWEPTSEGPWSIFVLARQTAPLVAGRVLSGVYSERRNWLAGWWNGLQRVFYHEGFVVDGGNGGQAMTTDWHLYSEASDGATVTTVLERGVLFTFNGNGVRNPNGALALSGYSIGGGNETTNCEVAGVIFYENAVLNENHGAVCDNWIGKYAL